MLVPILAVGFVLLVLGIVSFVYFGKSSAEEAERLSHTQAKLADEERAKKVQAAGVVLQRKETPPQVVVEPQNAPPQVVIPPQAVKERPMTPVMQSMESFKGYTPPTPLSIAGGTGTGTGYSAVASPVQAVSDRSSGQWMKRSATVKPTYLASVVGHQPYHSSGGSARSLTRRMSAPPEYRTEAEIGDLLKQTDMLRSRTKHFRAEVADQITYLKGTIHNSPISSPTDSQMPLLTGPRIDFNNYPPGFSPSPEYASKRAISPDVKFQRV